MIKFRVADAETQRLATIRAYEMGPLRFVFLRGVLYWGVFMFVFFTLYECFAMGYQKAMELSELRHTAIICLMAGVAYGSFLYGLIYRRYSRLENTSLHKMG
jgi:hypothetical protein